MNQLEQLRAIAARKTDSLNAFQGISELGRWPESEPLSSTRLHEAALRAERDAQLLAEIAAELRQLAREVGA